jgi:ParB/RepB/Spo0J family partition protein
MSRDIPLRLIDPDPAQPRKHFDPASLDELGRSMAANGLAMPILLRPAGERYVIVHGERRWRAARALGWEAIPADVRDLDPDEARWLALAENVQRADLTPIEEARAYRARLAEDMTQEALGARIGKSQSYIAQKLRLLSLPAPALLYLERGALSEGHARQLLRLRGMYAGMTTTFAPGALDDWSEDLRRRLPEIDESRRVMLFLNFLRPESVTVVPTPRDEAESRLIGDAIGALRTTVTEHGGTIPLWELGAFWRATVAVHLRLSVADLAIAIDRWHERFVSALAYWFVERGGLTRRPELPAMQVNGEPTDDEQFEHLLFWGYYADLRHGRVFSHTDRHGLPSALVLKAVAGARVDRLALPTEVQRRAKGAA